MPRYMIISCGVFYREVCHCIATSKNVVDVIFRDIALHDLKSTKMSNALQATIDQIDHSRYDAILLGYGLCNNGVANLRAPIPIVMPRAHDCITVLLGSKKAYDKYFAENPGTYFKSSGWLERDAGNKQDGITKQLGTDKSYESWIEEYGEENAEYLESILGNWKLNYKKMTFINNGIGDIENNRTATKAAAQEFGWEFEEVPGSPRLIEKLIAGDWNEDEFLVVPPNSKIVASYDAGVVIASAH